MNPNELIGIFLIAYLLGSIPFGLLLARFFGAGDLRSIGSGNIGATNVLRTGRKGLAIATLLLDLFKAVIAVKLIQYIYSSNDAALLAGLFVVIGHIFPIWLKFKGGKGVATAIGVFFALNWIIALIVCAVWFGVFRATRFSSLSAITSVCISPIAAYLLGNNSLALLFLALAITIIFTHRQNIVRLLNGTELAFKKKEK
ncbi:MAG: glycerol-3-phosphate 1-O-acyltransferase PlsY [Rickettsiales bacterium]|jgi:glycerol-3-phosphate acyltransferase PlsY